MISGPDPFASLTTITAIYAAIVATGVLIWDIYKWRRGGPQLTMQVHGDMRVHGPGYDPGRPYVTIKVSNRGDRATTLTNVTMHWYDKPWKRCLRRLPTKSYVITETGFHFTIPFVLEAGKVWDGMFHRDQESESMMRGGWLDLQVHSSHTNKGPRQRVKLPATH